MNIQLMQQSCRTMNLLNAFKIILQCDFFVCNTFRLQNRRKIAESKSWTSRHRMLRKRPRHFRMQVEYHKRNRRQMAKRRQGKQKKGNIIEAIS